MIPLIIAYILNIIDYLFTAHWVRLYGLEIEANPIGRWMFQNGVTGFFKIIVVGIAFAVLGAAMDKYPLARYATYFLLAVFAAIVAYHVYIAIKI